MGAIKRLLCAAQFALVAAGAQAGPILIVNGSVGTSEPGTTAAITANLQTLHIAAGNTVTISSDIPVDLSPFTQVWDIRFSNVFALTVAQRAQYLDYLQDGGGMFLMGENSGFPARNNSVFAFIAEAGGGAVAFGSPCNSTQAVQAPFTGPNAVASVNYAAPGCFNGDGTGDWITLGANGFGAGIAYEVGELANAAAGALTTILDVNFMQATFDQPPSQNLTKNLINFVGGEVEPPGQVPEPGSLALLGLALAGLGFAAPRRTK